MPSVCVFSVMAHDARQADARLLFVCEFVGDVDTTAEHLSAEGIRAFEGQDEERRETDKRLDAAERIVATLLVFLLDVKDLLRMREEIGERPLVRFRMRERRVRYVPHEALLPVAPVVDEIPVGERARRPAHPIEYPFLCDGAKGKHPVHAVQTQYELKELL